MSTQTKAGRYVAIDGVYEHRRIAEQALGRPLPVNAEVHHVNENPSDNRGSNLVICQDSAYHAILHQRTRALRVSGNPNYRRCESCKEWDALSQMKTVGKRIIHFICPRDRMPQPMVTASEPLFVTTDVIARALGFHETTVRKLMKQGKLPGRRFGSEYRMHKSDFAKLTAPQLTSEDSAA